MSKNTRNRILLTALAALLLVVVAVGGTVAWLVDQTTPVTNTFTTAGIDIDLTETKNPDGTVNTAGVTNWSAQLIPGKEYAKNPIVSVVRPTTDVDIWLFVKFEHNDIGDYVSYTNNLNEEVNGWTRGTGTGTGGNGVPTDVYYRAVSATETTTCGVTGCTVSYPHWHLIGGDKVTVLSNLAEGNQHMATSAVEMKYTAYAIQQEGFSAAKAWAQIGN